jgi:NitT/TauT family transport system substrate-binding protein
MYVQRFSQSGRFLFRALVLCALTCLSVSAVQGQDMPTVRVVGSPIDDFKPVYYGVKSGLFKRFGINVEIIPAASGSAALAAVIGGSAQVGFSSLPAILSAHLRGVGFKIVAPAQMYITEAPAVVLLVKKDSPIQTARELNGKTIAGQSLGDLNSIATAAWVEQNGGDSKTLKFVELPNSTAVPALETGRVDAFPVAAPYFDQALATGNVRILAKPYDAIAKRFEATAYVALDTYVANNSDAMTRFGRAMHDAIVYCNSHLPETADLVSSYSGVDAATVAKSVRAVDPEYVEASNLQPFIDFVAQHNIISRGFDASEIIASTVLKPPARRR